MDYEFYTTSDGQPLASCQMEGHLFGEWLSHEVSNNYPLLTQILAAIDALNNGQQEHYQYSGQDYVLLLDQDEAELRPKFSGSFHADYDELPEGTELAELQWAGCGLADFHHLLQAWADFVQK